MTRECYLARLTQLGLTQVEAAELLEASPRTGQRWAKQGPPLPVAMVLLAAKSRRHFERLRRQAEGTELHAA